jgi:hypothetical protein
MTLEPTVWDDTFLFPSDHEAIIKTSLVPSEAPIIVAGQVISQIHVFTQTDTVFVLSSATDLTMTLTAPDGTVITPDNYDGPPVYPTYTVSYSQSTIYQIKRAVEVMTMFQPRLRFIPASTHSSMEAVDVLVDGTVMFANVGLMDPAPHDYIPLNRGVHTIEIVPTGGGTLIISTTLEAEYETDYSVLASGVDAPVATVLTDDNIVPDALGQARVRFVQSMSYSGTVDVFVGGVQVLDPGLVFGNLPREDVPVSRNPLRVQGHLRSHRGSEPGSLDRHLLRQAHDAGVAVRFNDRVDTTEGPAVLAVGPLVADAIAVGYVFETDMADGNWICFDDKLAPGGYAYVLARDGRGTVRDLFVERADHGADG